MEIVLAPPFTALKSVGTTLGSASHIALGAQNVHWEQQGAFTGEISGPMLRDLGCALCHYRPFRAPNIVR